MKAKYLPQLPTTWRVLPPKALFNERREISPAEADHLTPSQHYGVLTQHDYMKLTGSRVVQVIEGGDNMKAVKPNDFIIHLRSFQGGIERSTLEGKVSPAYTVLTPNDAACPDYFRWTLKSEGYIQELRTTTNQLRDGQSIKFSQFASVPLPAPPLAEQRQIADYLDRETTQIDTLIAKQEQLIAILRERRAQTIATTVTHGLAASPPLRFSGTDWLGDVVSDWGLARVRHVVDISTGYGDTIDADTNGAYPFYVRSQTPLRSSSYDFEGPAVLTAGDGAGVAKVFHLAQGKFKAHQRVYVLNNFRGVLPDYFLAYFSSFFSKVALDGSAKSTVDSVRRPMISDMAICIPPIEEQHEIIAHLSQATMKIDTLIAKAERFIELSKERRTALITAAVTGQLEIPA